MQSPPSFRTISFSRVSTNSVCCVCCEGHKISVELSTKVINVLDLVFAGLLSEDSDPSYHAVPLRIYAGFDNNPLRAAHVRAVRISSQNLASMNVRTSWVHSPKYPFRMKGCPIPFVSIMASPRSIRTDPIFLDKPASFLLNLMSSGCFVLQLCFHRRHACCCC